MCCGGDINSPVLVSLSHTTCLHNPLKPMTVQAFHLEFMSKYFFNCQHQSVYYNSTYST